jgi:hypothetical protein
LAESTVALWFVMMMMIQGWDFNELEFVVMSFFIISKQDRCKVIPQGLKIHNSSFFLIICSHFYHLHIQMILLVHGINNQRLFLVLSHQEEEEEVGGSWLLLLVSY